MVLDRLDPATVAEIRFSIRQLVEGAGARGIAPSAALLTTELVAGAFERGARSLIVYAECDRRHVRVEVGDSFRSTGAYVPARHGDATGLRRRLLDELTDGWGSISTGDGDLVWFDVGIRSPAR
ncbi:MAG TPA: hypothetical protein VIB48_21620 [Acidimicrobiia bacterium]|jgi:hypothetical protein